MRLDGAICIIRFQSNQAKKILKIIFDLEQNPPSRLKILLNYVKVFDMKNRFLPCVFLFTRYVMRNIGCMPSFI